MKLCAWDAKRLKQHDADFMVEIGKRTPKLKVVSPSMAMASASVGMSSDGRGEQEQVQVKSEHANPSIATDSGQLTLKWSMMPAKERKLRLDTGHDAWDMFFFVNNVPFSLISSPEFRAAIEATKKCPTYKPVGRDVLAGSHLEKQSDRATSFNERTLIDNLKYGYVITGDGYSSKTKRQYHNFILLTPDGPVFLGIKDVTGEGSTSKDVFEEFSTVMEAMEPKAKEAIMLGILDTPSVNRRAWKLLMSRYPTQVWMGCMAHEVSLLFNDVAKLPATARLKGLCHYLVKWIMNHNDILALFRKKVKAHFRAVIKQSRRVGVPEEFGSQALLM